MLTIACGRRSHEGSCVFDHWQAPTPWPMSLHRIGHQDTDTQKDKSACQSRLHIAVPLVACCLSACTTILIPQQEESSTTLFNCRQRVCVATQHLLVICLAPAESDQPVEPAALAPWGAAPVIFLRFLVVASSGGDHRAGGALGPPGRSAVPSQTERLQNAVAA
jgi:hypothetical protein